MSAKVIIHCKPIVERQCYENEYNWSFSDVYGKDEIDILVDDVDSLDDWELCTHYGIDYENVNCIEAYNFCAV
tara:strand:- start:103 stop:321 length:219 start_codon:yes stop_codon:yes gene_type:complete